MHRRYAVIGLGHRSQLYVDALLGDWSEAGRLVAFRDTHRTRMDHHNRRVRAAGHPAVPCHGPEVLDPFTEGVDIDDTMSVLVRYPDRSALTYSLTAYAPREGYRVAITGTRGRLELEVCERPWTPPDTAIDPTAAGDRDDGGHERLTVQEHWKRPEEITVVRGEGGRGGGDALMLDDVLRRTGADPWGRRAGYRDGLRGVLTGVAADRSARTGVPVAPTDEGTRPAPVLHGAAAPAGARRTSRPARIQVPGHGQERGPGTGPGAQVPEAGPGTRIQGRDRARGPRPNAERE